MKTYKIPIIWETHGYVTVQAESLEAAVENALSNYASLNRQNEKVIEDSAELDSHDIPHLNKLDENDTDYAFHKLKIKASATAGAKVDQKFRAKDDEGKEFEKVDFIGEVDDTDAAEKGKGFANGTLSIDGEKHEGYFEYNYKAGVGWNFGPEADEILNLLNEGNLDEFEDFLTNIISDIIEGCGLKDEAHAATEYAGFQAVEGPDKDGWGPTITGKTKEDIERQIERSLERDAEEWGVRGLSEELLKASSNDKWHKGDELRVTAKVKVTIS